MNERIYNFSAGPAVLPVPVLEQAQAEMLSLPGVGMSVMEISHRSKHFDRIITSATTRIKNLLGLTDNYHVLFLQGGASLQFSMIPMNLLPEGASADYIVTGSWGKKAVKEAKRVGQVQIAATTEAGNFKSIPTQDELQLNSDAAYVHFTTNETIQGVQFQETPDTGSVSLIADASSDMLSRPLPIDKYAMIYAGAQKNLGPAGVTLVIIRDDLLRRIPDGLHTMLDYRTHVENNSLYNTPNTWGIYIIDLVCKWIEDAGGLEGMARRNAEKAGVLYDVIDSTEFYRGHAEHAARSNMIVTFRLPTEELEKQFIAEATAANLDGLKGHRSVGGLRASIYNAFPKEGCDTLADFMREFERKNG